jgi:hypothetical protein
VTPAERLGGVAETDSSFRRVGPNWVGKCLICNGPLAFDIKTREGATLELDWFPLRRRNLSVKKLDGIPVSSYHGRPCT